MQPNTCIEAEDDANLIECEEGCAGGSFHNNSITSVLSVNFVLFQLLSRFSESSDLSLLLYDFHPLRLSRAYIVSASSAWLIAGFAPSAPTLIPPPCHLRLALSIQYTIASWDFTELSSCALISCLAPICQSLQVKSHFSPQRHPCLCEPSKPTHCYPLEP